METLIDLLPSSAVVWTLAVLSALRVLILVVDKTVELTPSDKDNLKWTKWRNSFYMVFMEQLLYYVAGIKLPNRGNPGEQ